MTTVPPWPVKYLAPPAVNGFSFTVSGVIVCVPGAGCTSIQRRIRVGAGVGGAALGPAIVVPVTPSVVNVIPFSYYDFTGAAIVTDQQGNQTVQYSVTLQQGGAPTAGGNVIYMTCDLDIDNQVPPLPRVWDSNEWVMPQYPGNP